MEHEALGYYAFLWFLLVIVGGAIIWFVLVKLTFRSNVNRTGGSFSRFIRRLFH